MIKLSDLYIILCAVASGQIIVAALGFIPAITAVSIIVQLFVIAGLALLQKQY